MAKLRFKVGDKVQVRENKNSHFHKYFDIQGLEKDNTVVEILELHSNYRNKGIPYYRVESKYRTHCLNDDNLVWSQNKRLE